MTKKLILLFLLCAFILLSFGCGSKSSYSPPPEGKPKGTIQITNNCKFDVHVTIDQGFDGGTIEERDVKKYDVVPGDHTFEFEGTDDSHDESHRVYFETNHKFGDKEYYKIDIKFGVSY